MEDISSVCQAEIPFVPQSGNILHNCGMSDDLELMRQRLEQALADKGMSPRALSLRIGANHAYVGQVLRGKGGMPGGRHLAAMADALDVSADWLAGRTDLREPVRSEVSIHETRLPYRAPEPVADLPLVGTGDCAALEVQDESGEMVAIDRSSFDPEYPDRMIVRPPALSGSRDAYAIEFRGDSMIPRYEAGDFGIVDPRRAYGAGDYVLVQLRDGESDHVGSVIAKRLVRQSATQLVLEQFNPPLVFTVPRAKVLRIHRILRDNEYWS